MQDLASQLRSEISARIQGQLQGYFGDPHAINRLNATAFANGDLDIERARYGEHLLFQQMKIYPSIAFIYCGSARSGEFFGILRSPNTGELTLSYSNTGNNFLREFYSLDVRGYRQHWQTQANKRYDSRERPWFTAALSAEGPAWTDVYLAFTTGLPNVTASLPVYDASDRRVLGVCATDVVLPEEFRTFLKSLEIGKSGQAFVIDRGGNLISSSTDEPLMIGPSASPQLRKASQSRNPLVQKSVQYLFSEVDRLGQIWDPQQLTFVINGERHFLEVLPFNDGFGLDWLIIVVVPESDFMEQIHANTRITLVLCGIALAIAVGIGVFLTRQLTAPILELNAAVKDIAAGNWQHRIHRDRRDEIGQLADSVNRMAEAVQHSFASLEKQRNAFSRFFPPEYLRFLHKATVMDIDLGDHISQEMTVMFSDIRGFTSLAEKMEPQEIFDFLNTYLQQISPEIRRHRGLVVKFIGDGVMAIFPEQVEDSIDAAIAQLEQVRAYNIQQQNQGKFTIEIGIALHSGYVMVGMIGENNRVQPDAVSDTVNLTARLEELSKVYGVPLVISESVQRKLIDRDRYRLRFLDRVIVRGRTEPIAIYEVLDAETEPLRQLKLSTLNAFEAGLRAYGDREVETAAQQFEAVLAINPADKTAQLYRQRLQILKEDGIPSDWSGIWAFHQKSEL